MQKQGRFLPNELKKHGDLRERIYAHGLQTAHLIDAFAQTVEKMIIISCPLIDDVVKTEENKKVINMDDDTEKYLWALREINKSLVLGLETAIFTMDKWDELTPDRRLSIIDKLQGLVAKSKEAFGTEPENTEPSQTDKGSDK